jgi:hypothetical protein
MEGWPFFHDMILGAAENRPRKALAAAPCTDDIREAERDLEIHALVVVQWDAYVQLTPDVVFRDALCQLRIPEHALEVVPLCQATFLFKFASMELRNAARVRAGLHVGGVVLTVDFGTPSYKFTVNICTYLIF